MPKFAIHSLTRGLFPKYSESLKILDIRLQEGGAKRHLNDTSKSEHTDGRTHTQTHTPQCYHLPVTVSI